VLVTISRFSVHWWTGRCELFAVRRRSACRAPGAPYCTYLRHVRVLLPPHPAEARAPPTCDRHPSISDVMTTPLIWVGPQPEQRRRRCVIRCTATPDC